MGVPAGRRRLHSRRGAGALALAAAALALSGCGGGGPKAGTATSSLPPLPPNVVAYVTLAGSGSDVGYGDRVVPVTLTGTTGSAATGIHVGLYPDAVAVDSSDATAYVANYSSNSVTPISLATGRAGTPIPAGQGPADIAISPDGKTAYVTDDGSSSSLGHTVTPINLATRRPERPIPVGAGPQGIAITPDGATAYVADAGAIVAGQVGPVGHTVTPIDLSTDKPGPPITVGNGPTGVAISPDGRTVFVTNLDSGSVTPIATADDSAGPAIAVMGGPVAVAVGGGDAWVVDTPSNTSTGDNVTPISLRTHKALAPIPVGRGAQDIAVAPDGKTAWVTCLGADSLVPVDLATRQAGGGVPVSGGPFAVAVATVASGSGSPGASSTTSGSS